MKRAKFVALIGGACISFFIAGAATAEVINACVNNSDGTTRIVTSGTICKKNERSVYWNQQGPQGEQGLRGERGFQGEPGLPGETGSRGPSNAYHKFCRFLGDVTPYPPVCSLSGLPEGMYAVTGQVWLSINPVSPIPLSVQCFLNSSESLGPNPGLNAFGFTHVAYSPAAPLFDLVATGTIASATDVLGGESVWLSCSATVQRFGLTLTAIRVENLENQSVAP